MIRQNKQYFIYYLKDNILIFDVFDYIEELAADYVDYCFDWNLIKNNLVLEKRKTIKEFLEANIAYALNVIDTKLNKKNCKILCYFYKRANYNDWHFFFKNPDSFIKIAKSILKKKLNNFIEITEDNLFSNVKGTFDGFPCLLPTGEDEACILNFFKNL